MSQTQKVIKIDPEAILKKLQQNRENKTQNREKILPKDNRMVKMEKAGEYKFRAIPYFHNSDPGVEPFLVRYYHFLPSGTVFCPKMNCQEDCSICEFVWGQMSDLKKEKACYEAEAYKSKMKFWSDKLAKKRLMIAGIIRGREEEGVKFLSFSTQDNRPSDNEDKLYEWMRKRGNWLDPQVGFDMELTYKDFTPAQVKQFNAPFGLDKIDLEYKDSPFGAEGAWENALNNTPDIDVSDDKSLTKFNKKTSAEAAEFLSRWLKKLNMTHDTSRAQSTTADAVDDGTDFDTAKMDEEKAVEEAKKEVEEAKKTEAATTSTDVVKAKLAKLGIKTK